MTEIIKRNTVLLLTLALLYLSIYLTRLSLRYPDMSKRSSEIVFNVWRPVDLSVRELRVKFDSYWSHYLWLVDIADELERVLAEKKELERGLLNMQELANENSKLRDALQFRSTTGFSGVMASVVGFDPSSWSRTLKIDKGSRDGILLGYAVVDGSGLVGQVIQVSEEWSRVLLVDDKSSAVGVMLERVGIPAIVEGNFGENLRLSYVEQSIEVLKGDRVLTSGLDAVYPKGILVGSVITSSKEPGRIFQDILLKPATDPVKAQFVQVLIPVQAVN